MELKEVYNQIASLWADRNWNHHLDYCDDFFNIMTSRIGSGGKVLDMGCGSGEDCKFFYDHKISTVGIDFSEKLIEEAKKRFPQGKFQVMDIMEMDFPKESFDGVVAKHSLLHLPKKDMSSVLEKIHSLLKKDGWFLLTLKEGIGEKIVTDIRFDKKIERFFSFYTNFEVRKLLEGQGFELFEEGILKTSESTVLKFLAQKV